MARTIVLLLDSFGIGASHDAANYGDEGADTLGHIVETCARGDADRKNVRSGPLYIPNMSKLGLFHAAYASTGQWHQPVSELEPIGYYGYAVERGCGKDTPSGHWELAGQVVTEPWGHFPHTPSFPQSILGPLMALGGLSGVLGNCHASGLSIIEAHGYEHMQTHQPIVYTSADSVLQIAAHEESFGLGRLYELCEIARVMCDEHRIGRVIARPFIGEPGAFQRTGNRRDYTMPPPGPTLLDRLIEQGGQVFAVGKVADIFAHQGVSHTLKAHGNNEIFSVTQQAMAQAPDHSLIFSNFVDFDSLYGHRRDVAGYAHALEMLDAKLPELFCELRDDDMVVLTADHGCDPTMPGSDHTREHIPVLAFGPSLGRGFIGQRGTFADVGQSIASYMQMLPLSQGLSFLNSVKSEASLPWVS